MCHLLGEGIINCNRPLWRWSQKSVNGFFQSDRFGHGLIFNILIFILVRGFGKTNFFFITDLDFKGQWSAITSNEFPVANTN